MGNRADDKNRKIPGKLKNQFRQGKEGDEHTY